MIRADLVVDHGPDIGLGHLRRCLVLAGALRARGIATRFLVPTAEAEAIAAGEGHAVAPWSASIDADIVVVDAYGVDPAGLTTPPGAVRLWIDDVGGRALDVEVVLNPNGYGDDVDYAGRPASVLAGLTYSLVAPRFVEIGRTQSDRLGVLVAFGGTDDGRLALPVARSIDAARPDVPIDVVISPSHDAVAPEPRIVLHHGADMAALMARRSVYVGAAGGTAYEAMAAGLTVVACPTFDNQEPNARHLATMGATVSPEYDPQALVGDALRAIDGPAPHPPSQPDGRGPMRIVDHLLDLVNGD